MKSRYSSGCVNARLSGGVGAGWFATAACVLLLVAKESDANEADPKLLRIALGSVLLVWL